VPQFDPRFITGELTGVTVGMISAKDRYGNTFKTTRDDPRWATGEIAGVKKQNWDLWI
jgi:hypothetical protein